VDFFTPIVDDPYDFGRIAVANSLSDVYAMGGTPVTAMNVVCFPKDSMDIEVLREVLRGGLDAMHQAGVILVGGHTVDDPELKYGLSVTGTIHPGDVVHNYGARVGDRLVLTKPIGTGIIGTAIKQGSASPAAVKMVTNSMTAFNKTASELMKQAGAHACTDITGFGLLGHAGEMIDGTEVGYLIRAAAVPTFQPAVELVEKGVAPGGLGRNRDYRGHQVDLGPSVAAPMRDLLWDPQTSGGLLIAVPAGNADGFIADLHKAGVMAAVIGEVTGDNPGRIKVE